MLFSIISLHHLKDRIIFTLIIDLFCTACRATPSEWFLLTHQRLINIFFQLGWTQQVCVLRSVPRGSAQLLPAIAAHCVSLCGCQEVEALSCASFLSGLDRRRRQRHTGVIDTQLSELQDACWITPALRADFWVIVSHRITDGVFPPGDVWWHRRFETVNKYNLCYVSKHGNLPSWRCVESWVSRLTEEGSLSLVCVDTSSCSAVCSQNRHFITEQANQLLCWFHRLTVQ